MAVQNDAPAWEVGLGCLGLGLVLFFAIKNKSPVVCWAVWAVLMVLPFINNPSYRQTLGPSRHLYLSSVGASFVLAWGIRFVVCCFGVTLRPIVFSGTIMALIVSSYFSLKCAEGLSLYVLGRSYIASRYYREGAVFLEGAIERAWQVLPFDIYAQLAIASFTHGHIPLRLLEEGWKRFPDQSDLHLLYGIALSESDSAKAGQRVIADAFSDVEDPSELQTTASIAYQNLGYYYFQKGQWEQAVVLFENALQYRPNDSTFLSNLSMALYRLNRNEEAIDLMERVLARDPENLKATVFLGNMFFETEQLDAAISVYTQALFRYPNEFLLHHNLGSVYKKQGRTDLAMNAYKRAVTLSPKDIQARNRLATMLAESGAFQEAMENYETMIVYHPKFVEGYVALAQVYEHLGRKENALAVYEKVLILAPQAGSEIRDRMQALKVE